MYDAFVVTQNGCISGLNVFVFVSQNEYNFRKYVLCSAEKYKKSYPIREKTEQILGVPNQKRFVVKRKLELGGQ